MNAGAVMSFTAMLVLAPAARAQADAAARVDSVLRAAERNGFSGSIRVERNGAVLLEKGYGLADRAAKVPFTPATVVQIGSNTKDITVVALLQLRERGLLRFTDSLGKYFRDAPPDKRNITLLQLMDHTSGIPGNLGPDFEPIHRDAFIARALSTPLRSAPGASEQYSNAGYSLLAAIIEMVSHQTYDEFVRDNILVPLKLTHTGLLLPRFDERTLAHGYRPDGTDNGTMLSHPHDTDGPYWNLRGNGGMLSTLTEMHTFYSALFDSNVLMKPETRAIRFDPGEMIGLAGSDGVSVFAYDRYPRLRLEIIIATTNGAMRPPAVRPAIERALGLAP